MFGRLRRAAAPRYGRPRAAPVAAVMAKRQCAYTAAMRLMIAGGGGFRVPLVYRALGFGPLRRAGQRTGAVRRRPRPARCHQPRCCGPCQRPAGTDGSTTVSARPPAVRTTTSLPDALRGHGPRVCGHPARRDGRPDRRRTRGPGPRPAGPGNHRRRRHLLRAADHPATCWTWPGKCGTTARTRGWSTSPTRRAWSPKRWCPSWAARSSASAIPRAGWCTARPALPARPCLTEGSTAWATTG